MDIYDQITAVLQKRHDQLQDDWEDIEKRGDNPFDQWNAFLDEMGLVNSAAYEYNWNEEWGIPVLIGELFDAVNDDKQLYAVEFDSGSNMNHTYFFDREKIKSFLASSSCPGSLPGSCPSPQTRQ